MTEEELKAKLATAVHAIVESDAQRKIVVAGPGAGKTYMFRQVLERRAAGRDRSLVLTFINNLKNDIERDLGELARVFTFHGYCRHLLHRMPELRAGLTEAFRYFPPIATLINQDWVAVNGGRAGPRFVALMRDLAVGAETAFYLDRATYYDAVGFDDSVFRVHTQLTARPDGIPGYDSVLVDEYQDFNRLEAEFIALLARQSPTLIAGDDDQALYVHLRGSSPNFIRGLYGGGEYARFPLPFCMRCTAPVVGAVHDVLRHAQALGKLAGRMPKPFEFYPPKKASDSQQYPRIKVVQTSVQMKKANYFGRYIEDQIRRIPAEEITESHQNRFPTVLVIGPAQYLRQIREHLDAQAYACDVSEADDPIALERDDGLRLLREQPDGNLGWRVMLEVDQPDFAFDATRAAVLDRIPLVDLVPEGYRTSVMSEVAALEEEVEADPPAAQLADEPRPTIKLTSYEGSKGLSAQHVFIVGLHEGELPRNARDISDLEICKFVVALTRTRKQCHLIYTSRWSGQARRPSVFLSWIDSARSEYIRVTKTSWQKSEPN